MKKKLLSFLFTSLMLGNTAPIMAMHWNSGFPPHAHGLMDPRTIWESQIAYNHAIENVRIQCNKRFQQTITIDQVTYNTNHALSDSDLNNILNEIRNNEAPVQVRITVQQTEQPKLSSTVTIITFPELLNPNGFTTPALQRTLRTTLQEAVRQVHNAFESFNTIKNAVQLS